MFRQFVLRLLVVTLLASVLVLGTSSPSSDAQLTIGDDDPPTQIGNLEGPVLIAVHDSDIDVSAGASNPVATLSEPVGGNSAAFRNLKVWFRIHAGSCESDIRVAITAPNGSTRDFDPFDTCENVGNWVPLLATASVPESGQGTWRFAFEDGQPNATGPVEYTVAAVRIDAGDTALYPVLDPPAGPAGNITPECTTQAIESDPATSGDPLRRVDAAQKSGLTPTLPADLAFSPGASYVYDYVTINDQLIYSPDSELATASSFEGADDPSTEPEVDHVSTQTDAASVERNHTRVRAQIVLTPFVTESNRQLINAEIVGACSQGWSASLPAGFPLETLASETPPANDPDQIEDVTSKYSGTFQFERFNDGTIGQIRHQGDVDIAQQIFREGLLNALPVDLTAAETEASVVEQDRTVSQTSHYQTVVDAGKTVISRTATIAPLGLSRRADVTVDDGIVSQVRAREELTIRATRQPQLGQSDPFDPNQEVPWNDETWEDPEPGSHASPIDGYVLQTVNLGLTTSHAIHPDLIADATAQWGTATIANELTTATAEIQVARARTEEAPALWEEALELIALGGEGTSPSGVAFRDELRPAVMQMLTQAISAEPSLATQAANTVLTTSDRYRSQVMIASLASAAAVSPEAEASFVQIVRNGSVLSYELQFGALANAISVPEPSMELLEAVLARAQHNDDIGATAAMVAGALGSNSSNGSLRATVEDALTQSLVGSDRRALAAAAGLENLGSASALEAVEQWKQRTQTAPAQAGPEDAHTENTATDPEGTNKGATTKLGGASPSEDQAANEKPARPALTPEYAPKPQFDRTKQDTCTSILQSPGCYITLECNGEGTMECWQAAAENCDELRDEPAWSSYCSYWDPVEPPPTSSSDDSGPSSYRPPEPGQFVWRQTLGPKHFQGHAWVGIRPVAGEGVRLGTFGADAGLEVRTTDSVQQLFFGQAVFTMDRTDSNAADNIHIGSMEVGQISRKLLLEASWRDKKLVSKSTEFICGVGDSGELFPEISHNEAHDGALSGHEGSDNKQGKLMPEVVWGGPAVDGAIPLFGVVKLRFGLSVSARISGTWSWSADICDSFTSNVIGTAAAEVGVFGSVTVRAYAALSAVLLEAGINLDATVYSLEAPLRASVQLIDDQGALKIVPCYGFDITPTAWKVKVSAYAKVFIGFKLFGRDMRTTLWSKSKVLADFNLGQEVGLGGSDGTWTVFSSDCPPTVPYPPIIVAPSGEGPDSSNGTFNLPLLQGPNKRLPIGLGTGGDGLTLGRAYCAAVGFAAGDQAPTTTSFASFIDGGGSLAEAKYFANTLYDDSGSGVALTQWAESDVADTDELVTQVHCGDPVSNTTGDITISAAISINNVLEPADANDVHLRLTHDTEYDVTYTITNTSEEPYIVSRVVSDGFETDCVDLALAASDSVSCTTSFRALVNPYGAYHNAEFGVDDAVVTHSVHVEFANGARAPEGHAWYHGIDPATFDHAITATLKLGTDDYLEDTWSAPGPQLGSGQGIGALLTFQTTGPIDQVSLSAPFDNLECQTYVTNGESANGLTCFGEMNIAPWSGTSQQTTAIVVTLADGTVIPVDLVWHARFDAEPDLRISTTLDGQWANAYPGPTPTAGSPSVLRFGVSSINDTELTAVEVSYALNGSQTSIALPPGSCMKSGYLGAWACDVPGWSAPNPLDLTFGVVTADVTWGAAGQTSQVVADFYVNTHNTVTPDVIAYPLDGDLINVGETGTGTGSFLVQGNLNGRDDVSVSVTDGEILDLDVDVDAGTWEADVLAYPSGDPAPRQRFQTQLSATVSGGTPPPDSNSGDTSSSITESIIVDVLPPQEGETIVNSQAVVLNESNMIVTSSTFDAATQRGTMTITRPANDVFGDTQTKSLEDLFEDGAVIGGVAPGDDDSYLRTVVGDPVVVGETVTVDTEPAILSDLYRQLESAESFEQFDAPMADMVAPSDIDFDWGWQVDADVSFVPTLKLDVGPWTRPIVNEFELSIDGNAWIDASAWAEGTFEDDIGSDYQIGPFEKVINAGYLSGTLGIVLTPVIDVLVEGEVEAQGRVEFDFGSGLRFETDPVTGEGSWQTPLDLSYFEPSLDFAWMAKGEITADFGARIEGQYLVWDTAGVEISVTPHAEISAVSQAEFNALAGVVDETPDETDTRTALPSIEAWTELGYAYAWQVIPVVEVNASLELEIPFVSYELAEYEIPVAEWRFEPWSAEATSDHVEQLASRLELIDFSPAEAREVAVECMAMVDRAQSSEYAGTSGISSWFRPVDWEANAASDSETHWCNFLPVYMPGSDVGNAGWMRAYAVQQQPAWAVQARVQRARTEWYAGQEWPNNSVPKPGPRSDEPYFGWDAGCKRRADATPDYTLSCDEFPNRAYLQGGFRIDSPNQGQGPSPVIALLDDENENKAEGSWNGLFFLACGREIGSAPSPKRRDDMSRAVRQGLIGPDHMFLVLPQYQMSGNLEPITDTPGTPTETRWICNGMGPLNEPVEDDHRKIARVALGDSFASGEGAGSYDSDAGDCHRSEVAYPWLDLFADEVWFSACSGAKIENIIDVPQSIGDANEPQVRALENASAARKFVTLSIGGNDVDFEPTLKTCARRWLNWVVTNPPPDPCSADPAITEPVMSKLAGLEDRLVALYEELLTEQHIGDERTTLYVLGYPKLFAEPTHLAGWSTDCWDNGSPRVPFFKVDREWMDARADDINAIIESAIDRVAIPPYLDATIQFLPVDADFLRHSVCAPSGERWIQRAVFTDVVESFHPNADGHVALGDIVHDAMRATLDWELQQEPE